jgi:asparagine synthase (glutamine-hydrolysing)
MCGIAGILNLNNNKVDPGIIQSMTDAVAHRGPDAEGIWNENEIALGHRRLSIIDLSTAANQPFTDNSGRFVTVFNGEIYNYNDVKRKITAYDFRTTSDTEVLVAAYAKWGADCLHHFRGMFAFAIWDKQEKELFLARDCFGVKPLYFFIDDSVFLFSSEIRSVLASNKVRRKVNANALYEYFSYQSVSYPYSIIENVSQIEAGSWMKIKNGKIDKKRYWDVTKPESNFDFNNADAVQKNIKHLLLQSVERRLVSDVPVASFLSGGIDSSAIVGLMAEASSSQPNTFNISFEEGEFNEAKYAELISKKFNTNHTSILLKPSSFLDELENALNAIDRPSADGINTYVVSKAIQEKGIRVALSGIGGDELFAGYPIFSQYLQLQQRKFFWEFPSSLRRIAASLIAGTNKSKNNRIAQVLNAPSCSIENLYPFLRQIFSPKQITTFSPGIISGDSITSVQKDLESRKHNIDKLPLLSQVSVAEYLGYTQNTLLKDTDQMGMAVALEIREPYFDQDLVEFVLNVPDQLKKPTYPKSLLVESLKPMLPDEIVFRKKQGFLFPWAIWLKNELRTFCDEHIKNLSQRPFMNEKIVLSYWQRFLSGDKEIRWAEIWVLVVLEHWLKKNDVE